MRPNRLFPKCFEPAGEPKLSSSHIPLDRAYLCSDCSCVGNNSRTCPACASEVLMGLAGVLDREEVAA